jgi:hypothetical protein
LDALPELIRILINEAMRMERQQHLGADHMSDLRSARDTPMASSPNRFRPVWVRLNSISHRCSKATSIQTP